MYRVYAGFHARINLGIRRRWRPPGESSRQDRIDEGPAVLPSWNPGALLRRQKSAWGQYLPRRSPASARRCGVAEPPPVFRTPIRSGYIFRSSSIRNIYQTINVEAQQNNPHSLLWWMKRLIALRKRHLAFGRGSRFSIRKTTRCSSLFDGIKTNRSWSSPTCRLRAMRRTDPRVQGICAGQMFGR